MLCRNFFDKKTLVLTRPSIISYKMQPNPHQSGLNVYRSFFTTSGARISETICSKFLEHMQQLNVEYQLCVSKSAISYARHLIFLL